MQLVDVIIKPLVSEKATAAQANGVYTFAVHLDAEKKHIKAATESLFNVTVIDVNTINVRGKFRRRGKSYGQASNWKKALVRLKDGDKIQVFEGV